MSLHTRIPEPPDALPRISFAQNQEDILLDRLFHGQVGTYVDIGANHPAFDNNTLFFHLRGWRGVNIEPDPRVAALYAEHRPGDLSLAVAASDTDGTLPFYEVTGADGTTGLSTLDAVLVETYRHQPNYTIAEMLVPVRTLATLIAEHAIEPPDLVSIDVENLEAAVLRGIPLETWRPRVFVIESTLPLTGIPSHHEWEPLLLGHGYHFAAFNGVNRFYLRDDLADALPLFETPVSVLDGFQRHREVLLDAELRQAREQLAREQADRATEHAAFAELRQAWEWGQAQARQAQLVWEQIGAAFDRERAEWNAAEARFAAERASWDAQRGAWQAAQADWQAERADWQAERAAWQGQLAATQRQLRPYRLLDRLGLIHSGYLWARRLKRGSAA